MLSAATLRQGLKSRRFGTKIYAFETIDSTNSCARALASCWAEEGTVVIAEQQTAGRGRMGRSWLASPGKNLTFSIILRPTMPPERLNLLPLYVGVTVARAVEKVTGLRTQCKWPNDLLLAGRKAAGILIEGSLRESAVDFVIVGIGVNVNQRDFPAELTDRATSLALEGGREYDREELFREIMRAMESHYKTLNSQGFESIIPEWTERSYMIGRRISVDQNGKILTGTVKGLNNIGALLLDTNGQETALLAGDVTILDSGYAQ